MKEAEVEEIGWIRIEHFERVLDAEIVLRRALEEIALHEVRENEPSPCDWHCTAGMVATARAALAGEETSGG